MAMDRELTETVSSWKAGTSSARRCGGSTAESCAIIVENLGCRTGRFLDTLVVLWLDGTEEKVHEDLFMP